MPPDKKPITSLPRIFVQIACYRDWECQRTLRDLFEKAAHPERIFVGICWQFDPEADKDCFTIPYSRPEQVRVVEYHYRESKGANWARAEAGKLFRGEEYTLLIDAHMRFEPGWDEAMLECLRLCDSPKPVLSTYPTGFIYPEGVDPKTLPADERPEILEEGIYRIGFREFRENLYEGCPPILFYHSIPIPRVLSKPIPIATVSQGFIFAPSEAFKDVPLDPHIYFFGDELNLAVRLWTHGWDMFAPARPLLYHLYETERPEHQQDHSGHDKLQLQTYRRNAHLIGMIVCDESEALVDIAQYPLGNARTMAEYQRFSGIDFAGKGLTQKALMGEISDYRRAAAEHPAHIFVAMPSYRDAACSEAVADLFAKARYPERIHVGVFLQADMPGKANIVTERPKQVRTLKIHHTQSQGPNWARSMAESLWKDEDYILHVESHTRFEPGWDETLIDMLARCPSEKPVISGALPDYEPGVPYERRQEYLLRTRFSAFGPDGLPQPDSLWIEYDGSDFAALDPSPLCRVFFMFARAEAMREVPIDPEIDFVGYDLAYSARLWTHGFDIFQPDSIVLFRCGRLTVEMWNALYSQLPQKYTDSLARVRRLLQLDLASGTISDGNRFGLGAARTLKAYSLYAGIDWRTQTVAAPGT